MLAVVLERVAINQIVKNLEEWEYRRSMWKWMVPLSTVETRTSLPMWMHPWARAPGLARRAPGMPIKLEVMCRHSHAPVQSGCSRWWGFQESGQFPEKEENFLEAATKNKKTPSRISPVWVWKEGIFCTICILREHPCFSRRYTFIEEDEHRGIFLMKSNMSHGHNGGDWGWRRFWDWILSFLWRLKWFWMERIIELILIAFWDEMNNQF